MNVSVIEDVTLEVTVRYEDSALVTKGIEKELEKQLDSLTDRVEKQQHLYCTEIIGQRSVREIYIRYTDPEGNVLAERCYGGE